MYNFTNGRKGRGVKHRGNAPGPPWHTHLKTPVISECENRRFHGPTVCIHLYHGVIVRDCVEPCIREAFVVFP